MTTARKVLDWHGQGGDELAKDLERLPAGRYVLVPENELEDEGDLSTEDEAAIQEALDEVDRGETFDGVAVLAEGRAIIDAAKARRAGR